MMIDWSSEKVLRWNILCFKELVVVHDSCKHFFLLTLYSALYYVCFNFRYRRQHGIRRLLESFQYIAYISLFAHRMKSFKTALLL
jgi:hypothetical protein